MKKNSSSKVIFALILISQFCLAQVDVVYKDLVWSDEFTINGPVNSSNWFHQTQLPAGGSWFNNEVQHYTNKIENSYVDNGSLKIVAKKESYTNQGVTKEYTSARLNSKFAYLYGRVDIRAKIPKNAGTWPALWLLGKNINEDGGFFDALFGTTNWPACGEIDILEYGITRTKPDNYIQSAMHTPSSFGNTVDIGGVVVGNNITDNYNIYSMNWSPNQISFLLNGVVFYTYNPAVKNASNWPFDKEQYFLLNIAMGGVAGPIDPTFTQTAMDIDYIRVYQNTTPDTQAPTSFTASVGATTGSTVELVLNATDDSGNVSYNVTYGSGLTASTFSPSGTQKSLVISNLSQNTNYTFTVTATDASGNAALSNPIVLNATTKTILQCSGRETQGTQGTFSLGYNYTFETIGTDVKINFELLDDRADVIAYLWRQSPFGETQMTKVSGKIFTQTITGQTIGSTISYACKFAFAGGLSVTKYLSYVVGSSCSLGIETPSGLRQFAYPNPVENSLQLQLIDDKNQITLTDVLGRKVLEDVVKSTHTIDMSSFKSGVYFLKINNSLGIENMKIIKK